MAGQAKQRPLQSLGTILALIVVLAACGGDDGGTTASPGTEGGTAPAEDATTMADSTPDSQAAVPFESIENDVPVCYEEPEPGEFQLAYLNPVGGNEFLGTLGEAMGLETERLGGSYTELDAQGDVDTQVGQFEQLVAQEVDGIFSFPLDPGAMQPVLERAKEAGIAVTTIDFAFDTTEDIGDYDSQIWQRRDEAAYLGAQQMFEQLGDGGQVATIDYEIQVPSIVYSIERARHWAEEFGLEIVGNASNPTDDIAGGEQAMTQLLGEFNELGGVIGYNDPSAIGAAAAARSQGQQDIIFGGQNGGSDGLQAIEAERIDYTAKLHPPSMGRCVAWGLYNILQGNEVPTTVKAAAPEIVTQGNIDSIQDWDEILNERYGTDG